MTTAAECNQIAIKTNYNKHLSTIIFKTMHQFHFFKSLLFFLSIYVSDIDSACFEDNTYFINAGYERFPSTQEKSPDLCQGLVKLN